MRPPAVLLAALVIIAGTQAQTAPPTAPPAAPVSSPAPPRTWRAPVIIINPKDWLPSPSPSPRRRRPLAHKPKPAHNPNAVATPEVFHSYDTGTPQPH